MTHQHRYAGSLPVEATLDSAVPPTEPPPRLTATWILSLGKASSSLWRYRRLTRADNDETQIF